MRPLPLHALRAFETAARLGAFNHAAAELGVSPTAISHHIRALEVEIGVKLFDRKARGISLTAEGAQLALNCTDAFSMLREAFHQANTAQDRPVITIAVGPVFAARWLSNRLSSLWAAFPEIELHLVRTTSQIAPRDTAADLYITWGDGNWPGVNAIPFLEVTAVPVANPHLLDRLGAPTDPAGLSHYPLLHYRDDREWRGWFQAVGFDTDQSLTGIHIEDANVLLNSCLDGQGVALGWRPLIDDEIKAGQLLQLFDQPLPGQRAYYLCVPKHSKNNMLLNRIVDWLIAERQIADQVR